MIRYRDGYKYQLAEDYQHATEISGRECGNQFCYLRANGVLEIKAGYAWDGPSGPTIDTKNFMRGSLVHDALYQLMEEGHLPPTFRKAADQELNRTLKADGMSAIRRWWVYGAVRWFGAEAVRTKTEIHSAP